MSDEPQLVIRQQITIEKKTPEGKLYEIVKVEADEQGQIVSKEVMFRKYGLAPVEAYANDVVEMKKES